MQKLETPVVFFQPIITHYRESLVRSILDKMPNAHFYGAKKYLTNKALGKLENNVHNVLNPCSVTLLNHRFFYFRGGLKKLLKNRNGKIIFTGYDPHMVHFYLYIFVLKILNKQFYWWSHANEGNQGKLGRAVRRIFYNMSKGIIAYSKDGKNQLLAMGIRESKIFIANNCLNFCDYGFLNFSREEILEKGGSSLNLIISGKLNKEKRIDILLRALHDLISKDLDVFCTIIGDGTEAPKLRELAKKLEIDAHVNFTGELFGTKLHSHMLNADIFILPGSVGLSILHAFSFGLPIICSDKMEIHRPEIELLEPGKNGDTFNGFDHISLSEKIIAWSKVIKNRRGEIFDSCVQSIKNHGYFPAQVAENILNAIRQ